MHKSVLDMWKLFVPHNPMYKNHDVPESFYFCDNEIDANVCADLVQMGIKQATAGALRSYETNNEALPNAGDLFIVTNWEGEAVAIIRTTKIELVPYNQITSEFASAEGEGDKTLEYWKKVHWDFYTREMSKYGESPKEDMMIVCEYFETIWT